MPKQQGQANKPHTHRHTHTHAHTLHAGSAGEKGAKMGYIH